MISLSILSLAYLLLEREFLNTSNFHRPDAEEEAQQTDQQGKEQERAGRNDGRQGRRPSASAERGSKKEGGRKEDRSRKPFELCNHLRRMGSECSADRINRINIYPPKCSITVLWMLPKKGMAHECPNNYFPRNNMVEGRIRQMFHSRIGRMERVWACARSEGKGRWRSACRTSVGWAPAYEVCIWDGKRGFDKSR